MSISSYKIILIPLHSICKSISELVFPFIIEYILFITIIEKLNLIMMMMMIIIKFVFSSSFSWSYSIHNKMHRKYVTMYKAYHRKKCMGKKISGRQPPASVSTFSTSANVMLWCLARN